MAEENLDESVVPEDTPIHESGDDGETANLEKRLADTQKAYHEGQASLKEMREEQLRMKGAMEVLSQGRMAPPEQQPDPFAEVDTDEFWSDYFSTEEKPKKLTQKMISVFGNTILSERKQREALEKRLTEQEGVLKKLREGSEKVDPALKAQIDSLREDPDLADLSDKKLAAIAAKMKPEEKGGYAGGPPSGGRVAAKGGKSGPKFSTPEAAKKYKELAAEAGWTE